MLFALLIFLYGLKRILVSWNKFFFMMLLLAWFLNEVWFFLSKKKNKKSQLLRASLIPNARWVTKHMGQHPIWPTLWAGLCKAWLLNLHMAEWFTQEVSQLPLINIQTCMGLKHLKKKKKTQWCYILFTHSLSFQWWFYESIDTRSFLCKVLTQDLVCLSSSTLPDVYIPHQAILSRHSKLKF